MLPMFEDDLIVIENSILCRCKNKMLKILDIPEGTEAIADEVFQNCSGLMAVTLPPTVTKIGENAFEGCSGLCSLELPKTLMHISPNAFSFCDKLQTVQIQNRFIDIDETAFENTVNIIIKAAQYSTSYEFAHRQHFRFTPAVFEEAHRIITSEQAAQLAKSGVMFQMKTIDSEKAVIRFDQGQRMRIESIIGQDPALNKRE